MAIEGLVPCGMCGRYHPAHCMPWVDSDVVRLQAEVEALRAQLDATRLRRELIELGYSIEKARYIVEGK